MKKITDSIEVAIANVQTSFPSIFSREDVVGILEGLHAEASIEDEEVKVSGLNEDQIDELIEQIKEVVSRKLDRMDCSELVDYSSAEFEMNYGNTVELTEVTVNVDNISDELDSVIEDEVKSYFENLVAEEKVEVETLQVSE